MIAGVKIIDVTTHGDDRGIFRQIISRKNCKGTWIR